MRHIHRILIAAIAILLLQAMPAGSAFAQATGQGGGESYVGGEQEAAGPQGASRPLEMPILYVTGVEVMRTAMAPKLDIVHVTGLVSSVGWSKPQLVPFFYGKPADDVLDLQFNASSPEQSQKAEGFVPVNAMFTLEPGHPYKGIRVRAAANALTVKQLPGNARAEIKAEDCKQCIGRKFAEKGKASAGTANTVREEDLPRGFRTITPTHGVAGIVHNPNRINLILDDNNTIVMAFWE